MEMSSLISKALGRWSFCIVFGLIATAMFVYWVPNGVAQITANRTLAPRILDEYYLTWNADDARQLFAALGPAGRRAYQLFYLKLDFWFPVLSLTIFYASLLSLAFARGSRFAWLNLLPIAMYFADTAENINHYLMAGSFPALPSVQLAVGPWLSFTKYVLITGLPIIAVLGFFSARSQRKATA